MENLTIDDLIDSEASEGAGVESKMKFALAEHHLYGFLSLDTHQNEKGIERFQGVVYWKSTKKIKPDYCMPIEILKKCKNYKIDLNTKKNGQQYVVWTIWFEEPFGIKKTK